MNASILSPRMIFALFLLAPSACAELVNVKNEEEFHTKVEESSKPSVVKFAADWCGVCKGVKKQYEELAQEPEFNHVLFVNVDIDQAKELTNKHGVVGVPTFIFMKDGRKVDEQVGVQDMPKFKETIRASLRKNYQKGAQTSIDTESSDQERLQKFVDEKEQRAKAEGILDSIIGFIKWILVSIIEAIQYTVDAIKGLFNK